MIDLKNFKPKHRTYKLVSNLKPVAYQIRTIHKAGAPLLCTDNNRIRELRYATNMDTPFVDEQDEKGTPTLSHVWLRDGFLTVQENEIPLQIFLTAHPDNKDNGGNVFQEIKPDEDAQDEIEGLEASAEAMSIARELNIDDASAIVYANVGKNIARYSVAEIRRDLLNLSMNHSDRFLNLASNELVKLNWTAHQAIEHKILNSKGNKLYFGKSTKPVMTIPSNKSVKEALTDFFLTDDGVATLEEIKSKLVKLFK